MQSDLSDNPVDFCIGLNKSPMSVEPKIKKSKLTNEERRARGNASKKAWEVKNYEQRRAYILAYSAAEKQALSEAGYVPKPVGRPPKDPEDNVIRKGRTCERTEAYREYQRAYHRQFRAKRRADGWLATYNGFIPPQHVEVIQRHRQMRLSDDRPETMLSLL